MIEKLWKINHFDSLIGRSLVKLFEGRVLLLHMPLTFLQIWINKCKSNGIKTNNLNGIGDIQSQKKKEKDNSTKMAT